MTKFQANDCIDSLPIRPAAIPQTPTRKKVLFCHPIKSAIKGIVNLVITSKLARIDITVAISIFDNPRSLNMNGVKSEKFNSAKLAKVIPNIIFT